MQQKITKTHLAHCIEKTENEAKYDESIKILLSDKQVLARIAKHRTEEFKDYPISEIMECIEGEPEISKVSVYPGKKSKESITGMNSESKEMNEGEVTFDVRFYMITKDQEHIKIILNVEAQKKYYPGYHFEPRAVFYCARMISEQLDREFTPDKYDELKKVYSIWIFFEAPKKDYDTITEFELTKRDVYGKPVEGGKYDYLSISFIRLSAGRKWESKDKLIHMLDTLFSDELDVPAKKKILEDRHQMKMTRTLEGGMNTMCNVSLGIREKALEEGEKRMLSQLVQKKLAKGNSPEEIAEALEADIDTIEKIMKELT